MGDGGVGGVIVIMIGFMCGFDGHGMDGIGLDGVGIWLNLKRMGGVVNGIWMSE